MEAVFLENVFRILINSILTVSQGPDWWQLAVKDDPERRRAISRPIFKKAWRSNSIKHGLYCVGLSDLSEIMRANADFIREVIPVDDWLINIEALEYQKYVAHMNYPNVTDLDLIEKLYNLSRHSIPKLSMKGFNHSSQNK